MSLLAHINLSLSAAEEACMESQFHTAQNELDKADAAFEELRQLWPDLVEEEKGLLQAMVKPLKVRRDNIQRGIPKAVSQSMPKEARTEILSEEKEIEKEFSDYKNS